MTRPTSVAIIGAGLSGLSCAQALQNAGVQVTVYDKSRGVSGRMSTRRGEGWQADHGAQYFTARAPDFIDEVSRWMDAGMAARWTPRIAVLGGEARAKGELRDGLGDGSGDGLVKVAGQSLHRHVGVPRMTSPAQWLAEGLNVHAQHTVNALRRDATGWALGTAEHGWLEARFGAVLLAVPSPQAEALLRQGLTGPEAVAAAPLANVAAAVTMRGCWALMLRFDAPVDLPFDAAFVNAGPLRWIARDSHKPGRQVADGSEVWVLQARAEWSEAHIEDTPEAATEALLAAFAQWGGPTPQAASAHRWRYADSLPPAPGFRTWLPELRLGLCGDWLASGKVEGAWLSGRSLAAQLLGHM
jgi:renalase